MTIHQKPFMIDKKKTLTPSIAFAFFEELRRRMLKY